MPRISVLLLTALLCGPIAAEVGSLDPLFASDEIIGITLTGPLRTISKDRSAEPEFVPAQLSFAGATGAAQSVAIGLRARGISRRNPDACDFPPLGLNLPKEGLEGTVFAGQNKLKLVTQCHKRDNAGRYEQFVLKEHMIYKFFNRMTPLSFRARLVEVTYVDTDNNNTEAKSFGVFIEDKDHLAKRNGTTAPDVPAISRTELDPLQTNRVELFQFLIGNTDFSLLRDSGERMCCHNVVPLMGADGKYLPIPYDFDSTGVVNPPYAAPVPVLKIKKITDRLYRGKCDPIESFNQALSEYKDAKADIYAVVRQQPHLEEKTVAAVVDYLDEFFAIIDDPKQVDRQILSVCKK